MKLKFDRSYILIAAIALCLIMAADRKSVV